MLFYFCLQLGSGKRFDFGFRYAPHGDSKLMLVNSDNYEQQKYLEAQSYKQLPQGHGEPSIRFLDDNDDD